MASSVAVKPFTLVSGERSSCATVDTRSARLRSCRSRLTVSRRQTTSRTTAPSWRTYRAVTSSSLCWREGMDDWRPLGELPELMQLLHRPRPMSQRRLKRSPLRDVAGMLRSFSYAAAGSGILRGAPPPEEWEDRARATFMDGYFETVDTALLPPGDEATRKLLSIFELEKAVYELRYELNNRPDWVAIPVAGIARLLESNGGT